MKHELAAQAVVQSLMPYLHRVKKLRASGYFIDWYFAGPLGECNGVAEYKFRKLTYGAKGKGFEVMLALDKAMHGIEMAKACGVDFWFYVEFTNGLYRARIHKIRPAKVEWFGRTENARDSMDQEPCLMVPEVYFEKVYPADKEAGCV